MESISKKATGTLLITLAFLATSALADTSRVRVTQVRPVTPVSAGSTFGVDVTIDFDLESERRILVEAWDRATAAEEFYCQASGCINGLNLGPFSGHGQAVARLILAHPQPTESLDLRFQAMHWVEEKDRWIFNRNQGEESHKDFSLPIASEPPGPLSITKAAGPYLYLLDAVVRGPTRADSLVPLDLKIAYSLPESDDLSVSVFDSETARTSAKGYQVHSYQYCWKEECAATGQGMISGTETVNVPLLLRVPNRPGALRLRASVMTGLLSSYRDFELHIRPNGAAGEDDGRVAPLIEASVDGAPWQSQSLVRARREQSVSLRAKTVPGGEIRWYQLLPYIDHYGSNYGPDLRGSFAFDPIRYDRVELEHLRGRWEFPAFQGGVGYLLQSSPSPDYRQDLGTFWLQAEVRTPGRVVRSPGLETLKPMGLGEEVFHLAIRADDTYLGHLTSYFNVPGRFGSTPTQVVRHLAVDCADVLYAAYSLSTGKPYADKYVAGLTKELVQIAHVTGKEIATGTRVIRWGRGKGEVRPGDLIAEAGGPGRRWGHVSTAYQDANGNGIWDEGDLALHAGPMALQFYEGMVPSYSREGDQNGEAMILRYPGYDQGAAPAIPDLLFSRPVGWGPPGAAPVAALAIDPPELGQEMKADKTPPLTLLPSQSEPPLILIPADTPSREEVRPVERAPSAGAPVLPGRFPDASTRLLTDADFAGLSRSDLRIMRNEIFARRGYCFRTAEMKRHFEGQDWYRDRVKPEPMCHSVAAEFTEIEMENVEQIKSHEQR